VNPLDRKFTRRRFLQAGAGTAAAVALGGLPSVSRVMAQDAPTGVFNWLTWGDHSYREQLDAVQQAVGISPNITEFADNAEAYTRILEVGGQIDMVSGDALWVPKFYQDGLIEAWDINSLDVAKTLYPLAREFEIWTTPDGYLGYPFGWSPVQIYYNPAYVSPEPDSWEVLLDPKYKGRVVTENQPVEVMAYMGKYTGAADPYNMTDAELAEAKSALELLKPNVLKLTQQASETWDALANEEAWVATANLGADEVVKDQLGGPQLKVFTPKEGTIGWMDSEMVVKGGQNESLIMPFLDAAEQPEYIAENFRRYGRPLFNEGAYKLLVDAGEQERADRYLFNKPETVLTMTLKGPGTSTEGAINAFNEVFGA
jgi:spermidine/putrescine-binding protein